MRGGEVILNLCLGQTSKEQDIRVPVRMGDDRGLNPWRERAHWGMHRSLLLLLAAATRVLAAAGTDPLVGEYGVIEKRPDWPKGMYEMLLDPSRKVGWNSWFSECPNDLSQYAFAARTNADAQRLIDALAKVEAKRRVVVLNPGRGPHGLGDWGPKAEGREWGAEVAFGNAAVLKRWFEWIAPDKDGKRRFGSQVIAGPPEPCPPTLTIYLGTANIEPADLVIPKGVMLEIQTSSPWPGKDYEKQVEKLKALEVRKAVRVKSSK
jgi:hypothetical protein